MRHEGYFQPELPLEPMDDKLLKPFKVGFPSGHSTIDPIIIEPLAQIRARGPEYAAHYARHIVSQYSGSQANQVPRLLTKAEAARYLGLEPDVLAEKVARPPGSSHWTTQQVLAYRLDPRTVYAEI